MKKLLIVTRNQGKLPEIRTALGDSPFEPVTLGDIPGLPVGYDVEESAMTFEGNAIIKAMTLGQKTGLLSLADDSGLEVDALRGQPGVYSHRYAPGSDEDRYRKLLKEMENVREGKRGARFRAVLAIYDPSNDKVRTVEGVCEGVILREPRASNGFGYDPVFSPAGLERTNAELTLQEKNATSHRGLALRKAREILEKEFSD